MSSKSVFFENLKKNKRIIAGSLLIIVVSWVLITALRSPNENEKIDKANEFLTNQTSEEQLEILKKFKDRKTQTFDYGLFNKIIIEKNELFDINLKKLFYYSNFKLDSYDNDTILIHLENGKSIIKRFNTERWDSSGLELSNYSSLDEIEKFYKFANSLVIVTNISNENINENNNFIDFSLIERGERYNSVKETKHNKYYGMHLIQNNSEIKSDTVSITYLNYCDYESVLKVDSNIVFIGYSLEKAQIFLIPINSENFKKDLIEVEIPKGIKIVDVTGNLILALNEMDTCIYTCKLKKNENNIFEIQIGNKFLNKGAFDLDNFSNCSFFSHDNINYVYNFNTVKIALIKNGSVYKDSIDVGNNYILSKSYKAKLIFKKDYKTDEDIEFKLFSFSENSIDTSIYRFDPYFARSKAIVTSIGGHLYVTFMSTIVDQITYSLEKNNEGKIINKAKFKWEKYIGSVNINTNYSIISLIVILFGILIYSLAVFKSLDNRGKEEEQQRKKLRLVLADRLKKDNNKSFEILLNVLEGEEKSMNKTQITANYLLISGVLIAIIGIAFSYIEFDKINHARMENEDTYVKIKILLSPVVILIFVESLALFFLKQYRNLLNDYKYYHHIYLKRSNYLVLSHLLNINEKNGDIINKQKLVEDMLEDNGDVNNANSRQDNSSKSFKDIAIEIIKKFPMK